MWEVFELVVEDWKKVRPGVSSVVFCLGLPFLMAGGILFFIAWSLFDLAIKISDPEEE